MVKDNRFLGTITLNGLLQAPKGKKVFEIIFHVEAVRFFMRILFPVLFNQLLLFKLNI